MYCLLGVMSIDVLNIFFTPNVDISSRRVPILFFANKMDMRDSLSSVKVFNYNNYKVHF